MKLKKSGLILLFLFLVSFLVVSCTKDKSDSDLGELLREAVGKMIWVGQLKFLGAAPDALVGFMRVLVGILVFAVLFGAGAHLLPSKNIAIVIAGVLSAISVIFIPVELLAAIGVAYGGVVAFVLIGGPILLGGFILYKIPSSNTPLKILKIGIMAVMLWILFSIKSHALTIVAKAAGQ